MAPRDTTWHHVTPLAPRDFMRSAAQARCAFVRSPLPNPNPNPNPNPRAAGDAPLRPRRLHLTQPHLEEGLPLSPRPPSEAVTSYVAALEEGLPFSPRSPPGDQHHRGAPLVVCSTVWRVVCGRVLERENLLGGRAKRVQARGLHLKGVGVGVGLGLRLGLGL